MLFKPKQKYVNISDVDISIDNIKIPLVHSTIFLGVVLDDKLTWKDHINSIACKISQIIGALNRLKKDLPQNILINIYQSMIMPYLSYCNIV